uniref:Uncharacterized protein n=1 Tax=Oryza barthii TaxID=65489 RepID=A0A0D3FTX1_9ORYZ
MAAARLSSLAGSKLDISTSLVATCCHHPAPSQLFPFQSRSRPVRQRLQGARPSSGSRLERQDLDFLSTWERARYELDEEAAPATSLA